MGKHPCYKVTDLQLNSYYTGEFGTDFSVRVLQKFSEVFPNPPKIVSARYCLCSMF